MERLRYDPEGGPISALGLSIVVARLNSRHRRTGLSSRELWTQRFQFTHDLLPVFDRDVIIQQHKSRLANHPSSEKCKAKSEVDMSRDSVCVGDLVYLYSDKSKLKARSRYLVVSCEGDCCFVQQFAGSQVRASYHKVKRNKCYCGPVFSVIIHAVVMILNLIMIVILYKIKPQCLFLQVYLPH